MKTIAFYHAHIGRIGAALLGISVLMVFLYGIFLLMAVAHTAHLATAEQHIQKLEGKVSELQAEYLAQSRALTIEQALALGFVEPAAVAIVYAAPTSLTLNH